MTVQSQQNRLGLTKSESANSLKINDRQSHEKRSADKGISKTAAIHQALSERLHRLGVGDTAQERLRGELRAIRERVARLPDLDHRSDEEIIGYDEHGIPN